MTPTSTDRRTLEQRYAASVYARVQAFANAHPTDARQPGAAAHMLKRNGYGGMAHKLPVLIRTAGLMQALHFASTRKKPEQQQLLGDLASVLDTSVDSLLARTREAAVPEYMHLTRQVLAVLVWFKRFAQSILDVDGSEQSDDPASPGAQV